MNLNKIRLDKKTADRIIFAAVIILVIFRVWLSFCTPLKAKRSVTSINAAYNILMGDWLGSYQPHAIAKGSTFPIISALCGLTRIPYSIALSVFNIFSAFVFVSSIKKLIKHKYFGYFLFLILIYSPITFYEGVVQVVYRNALAVPLILLIFGGCLGIYLNRESFKSAFKYSLLLGAALFLFINLREDYAWILPFVLTAYIIIGCFAVFDYLKSRKVKKLLKEAACLAAPIVIAMVFILLICRINYRYYGIFALNDRTYTDFSKVVSYFIKIDYPGDSEDENLNPMECYMSRDKFEYIIDHSESLTEYKDIYLTAYEEWAENTFKGEYVNGDHIQWAFRNGLSRAGFYRDGLATMAYLKDVKNELEAEVKAGNLTYKDGIFLSSSTKMITFEDIPTFLKAALFHQLPVVLSYDALLAESDFSTFESHVEVEEAIQKYEYVYNSYFLNEIDGENLYWSFAQKIVAFENKMESIYVNTAFAVEIAAAIAFAFLTLLQIPNIKKKDKKLFDMWLLNLACFLCIFVQLFMFSIFGCWMPLNTQFYCSSAYILLQIFLVCSIYFAAVEGFGTVKNYIENKK